MLAAAGLTAALPVTATESQAAPASGPPTGPIVTLLTGDRVGLVGSRPRITPGPGRERMSFRSYTDNGHVFVVPADAAGPLAAGRLDRRLFDVTTLARSRYAGRSDVPLIVTGDTARLRTSAATGGRHLPSIGGTTMTADAAGTTWRTLRATTGAKTLAAGVSKIWLDAPVEADLDHSVPQIGAPTAWQAGHTGKGTEVAVLDSGIDTSHPDLADAVTAAQDFSGSDTGTTDAVGHGTHVASIITGSGAASDGRYRGVAPDTRLLNAKVIDDNGDGSDSTVIAGMEWAVAHGADVLNLSLGNDFPSDGTDPVSQAVDRLTADSGALFVVASGNTGPTATSVGSPGAADAALTVGAVDREDRLAEFSSRGPRPDGAIKPDLTAPGVGIVAARAANATIGEPVGERYLRLGGTSMAAPHVAGAAAILAGQHPGWTAAELKAALMDTAVPNPALSPFEQGTGRVDIGRATAHAVHADTGSLSLGTAWGPHADDAPIVRTIGYHHDSAAAVTLRLRVETKGPTGDPAPAGMFTLSTTTLTVPAGGDASVRLATDTRLDGPDGVYTGAVVADGGPTPLRTALAVTREVESYDVTFRYRDWAGLPTTNVDQLIVSTERPLGYRAPIENGTSVVRLPKGTYYYNSTIFEELADFDYRLASFPEPSLVVDARRTVTLDARDGQILRTRPTAHPEAKSYVAYTTERRDTEWGGKASTGSDIMIADSENLTVRPSRTAAPGEYTFAAENHLAGERYAYHLGWDSDGRVPRSLHRGYREQDLAIATSRFATQIPDERVDKDTVFFGLEVPTSVVERYTPRTRFLEYAFLGESAAYAWNQFAPLPTYASSGRKPAIWWNAAPFGPGFGRIDDVYNMRYGDLLAIAVSMHSDRTESHAGGSTGDGGYTRLSRDGVELASGDIPGYLDDPVEVGPEPATYRLETRSTRDNSPFSTDVSAAWTFRSAHAAGTTPQPLDLMTVRFAPPLDEFNRAPAGRAYSVPLTVDHVRSGRATKVVVEVSYDDGTTWQRVEVAGTGNTRTAQLRHPAGTGWVSLRATANGDRGNSVEQTIIHAYQLK